VYGWNDRVDRGTDRLNPRKGNWLFGARGEDQALDALPRAMLVVTALSFALLSILDGPRQLILAAGIAGVCWAYNREPGGWRGRPPLELLCQVGYLLVVPLSAWLNEVPLPPLATWLYLALFTAQAQLMGEAMDIEPDRAAGRATTATRLGLARTKALIIAVVAAEAGLAFAVFRDALFGSALLAFLGWLLLDVLVIFRGRAYTLGQMKLLGVVSNVMAAASMLYVWQTGCLLR
jgi:4-hydroxybenzoate polyprenyltransferase